MKKAIVVKNKPVYINGSSAYNPYEVHAEGAIISGHKSEYTAIEACKELNEKYKNNPNYTLFLNRETS
jgi:hypothetical protein